MNAKLLFVQARSPLHAGTGRGVGVIDLPIAREQATQLPYLPGSSLKGPLRDACKDDLTRKAIFGPDTNLAHEQAGAVQFTDARLLLLPVRSLAGTFAWVTAPYVLCRFARELREVGYTDLPAVPDPAHPDEGTWGCAVAEQGCALVINKTVYLEDLDLTATLEKDVTTWAEKLGAWLYPDEQQDGVWRQALRARLCIIPDDALTFLLNTALEVQARVRMNDGTKTVAEGGLWYEEALPTETVLAGLLVLTPNEQTWKTAPTMITAAEDIWRTLGGLLNEPLQLGGKATVGRGLCVLRLV